MTDEGGGRYWRCHFSISEGRNKQGQNAEMLLLPGSIMQKKKIFKPVFPSR